MSVGIFTRNKRVTFIKAQWYDPDIPYEETMLLYPDSGFVLVTLDQVAEIFYRVKDAWFTGGSVDFGSGDTIQLSGYDPEPALVYAGTADNPAYARGWYTIHDVPASMDSYFDEAYDPAFSGVSPIRYVREVISEYGMWTPDVYLSSPPSYPEDWFVDSLLEPHIPILWNGCGLTHYVWGLSPTGTPTSYGFYEVWDYDGEVTYKPVGAYVEPQYEEVYYTGESPLDPNGELYVLIEFALYIEAEGPLELIRTYKIEGTDSQWPSDFVIQLSNSTLTIPLWGEFVSYGSTDFVLTAKEWWPYAKDDPATPVWNTNTGEKL
jgi:hypothetical protein